MIDDASQGDPRATPETPFVGLVPYGEDEADFFFGREQETRIVAGNLRAAPLTLLYGASGVGKTSLLRAGVVRHLRRQLQDVPRTRSERAPFAICVFSDWRDDPVRALMETVRASASAALEGEGLPSWRPGDSVAETLRSWTEQVRTLLVILDQFEDYFLYHPEDGESTLASELPGIVNDPTLRVHLLLSVREDALAKLDRFKGAIPRLFANYIRVDHLDRAAARRAIEGPVETWNERSSGAPPYTLGPGLVDAVIEAAAIGKLALVRNGVEADTAVDGQHVEAPFLQLVMERLWRATVEADAHDLTLARLEDLGGPQRIVENHLLDALGALTSNEQAIAADLFRFLVTRSKTKIAHQVTDLAEWTSRPEAEVSTVLDRLCRGESGRILRRLSPPPDGGEPRYELFHDVLAEPILEWRREYEQEERRRATLRRYLRIGGILASLVAVFAALGIWALVQRSQAQSATRSATSLALASAARQEIGRSLPNALLLGLEAYKARPSAEAASALVEALEAARRSGAEAILRGGRDGVRAIAWSPDGSTLASADLDGSLHLWDTQARRVRGDPLLGHTGEVWDLAFSPDGELLASAGLEDGTIRFWDATDGGELSPPIESGGGGVRSVAFSPDGRILAATAPDDTIRLFDVESRDQVAGPLRGHEREAVSIAFSPDGRLLVSGGYDRTVRLWDVAEQEQLAVLRGHTGEVWAVAFAPDGSTVASGDRDGSVRLWDVASRAPRGRPLESPREEVWGVAFSPDGRTLASSSFDDTVRLWDARTGAPLGPPLRGHTAGVISIGFRPDGLLASASFDGTIRLWDLSRRATFGAPLRGHTDRVRSVAFGRDDRLASAGFDGTIRLWSAATARARRVLGTEAGSVESIAVSPDGGTLASAGGDGTIGLWSVAEGAEIGELVGHVGAVQSVAFAPDGRTLASGGFDGTVRLWDMEELEQAGDPLMGHEGPVWSVALGVDGRLASAGSDGTLRLWDVHERGATGEVPLPEGDVALAVAFAPDGTTLASGSVGGLVQLWDTVGLRAVGEPLRGHRDRVGSVAFGADGAVLVSASDDGTVRLWHVGGRRALGRPLSDHEGQVLAVAFARDGSAFASGGEDRTVRVWDGILWRDLADLESHVCSLVVRNLTEAEWEELVPGLAHRTTCPT